MIYGKVNYLSFFGKNMDKLDNIKIKGILKKNGQYHSTKLIDSYIDKNGIQKKSNYQLEKERKMFKSFFEKLFNYSDKDKEAKDKYFSKIKGYKNYEEEKYIKEKRKKRFQEIVSLKRKKELMERNKLFSNYNSNNNSDIPRLKKKEYLSDRNITSKLNNSNSSYLQMSSLPSIDKFNINLNKKFSSLPINKTNRISNISSAYTNNNNRTKNKKNILSARNNNQMHLFHTKLQKKKLKILFNNKNKYLQITDKYSKIKINNNTNNISKILSNEVKCITPIKKKINKNILISNSNINININPDNQKKVKRCSSSLMIKRYKNMSLNDSENIKKAPIKLSKYHKKWDEQKGILFDKIVGRNDNSEKKFKEIGGIKNYFPNYNSIFIDNSKSFVNYGKNKDVMLKNLKIDTTRKLISNWHNLINSPSNSYIVMDIIIKEKQKKKEAKINKLKQKFGQYYEIINKMKK